ncbi:MAG: 50S ribosomal protein L23 [Candidatus Omnitrophica bacterium]|jgi:large subunit ribosomal protein L23|nr:50S ribosomal protein L23 [Candidatus Omnitrophota bacterium]
MITSYDIIHTLLRTEKGITLEPKRQYFFEVAKFANKVQIRKAVEEIYNVKVADVNTQVSPGKRKRVRKDFGMTPDWKKAIVTLREGSKIDIT